MGINQNIHKTNIWLHVTIKFKIYFFLFNISTASLICFVLLVIFDQKLNVIKKQPLDQIQTTLLLLPLKLPCQLILGMKDIHLPSVSNKYSFTFTNYHVQSKHYFSLSWRYHPFDFFLKIGNIFWYYL